MPFKSIVNKPELILTQSFNPSFSANKSSQSWRRLTRWSCRLLSTMLFNYVGNVPLNLDDSAGLLAQIGIPDSAT